MTYINYILFISFILLTILLMTDIYTTLYQNNSKKKLLFSTEIIYSLFNVTINNNHSLNKQHNNNDNNAYNIFYFIIFLILFILIILPFIIYITNNNKYSIHIFILIIIIFIIGPYIFKIISYIFYTPINYLYNTKKRKKNIINI